MTCDDPTSPRPKRRQRREPVPRAQLPRDVWHVEHVAAFLGKGKDWVYDRVAENVLPHRKAGAALLFNPDSIVAWVRGEG